MNERFSFSSFRPSSRQGPLWVRLQRYALLLGGTLLLLLVLLPVIGLALFVLLWLIIGVAAGALILRYLRRGRQGPWRR